MQFEILADRIRTEYNVPVRFDPTRYHTARWVEAGDEKLVKNVQGDLASDMAADHNGAPVFLAKSAWHLTCTEEDWPQVRFLRTREQVH